MANPFWRNESLETYLDRWATERPDKTAIVDGRGRFTYAQVARDVERIAHGLRAHGVSESALPMLADAAFADGCHATNPVPVTRDDLLSLYEQAL